MPTWMAFTKPRNLKLGATCSDTNQGQHVQQSVKIFRIILPLVLASAPAWSTCTNWIASPELATQSSRWTEYNASGNKIVEERGTLQTHGVAISTQCNTARWSLTLQDTHGQRDYRGLSNRGQMLETRSSIRHHRWSLAASIPITSGWSWGIRLHNHRVDRNLESIAQASGYAEDFRYWIAETGLELHKPLTSQWAWTAGAWVGHIPSGRMYVDLPNADPVTLRLGTGYTTEWRTGLSYNPTGTVTGWQWLATWRVRTESISAGADRTLFRGQQLVGSARQPETRQHSSQLALQAQYRF